VDGRGQTGASGISCVETRTFTMLQTMEIHVVGTYRHFGVWTYLEVVHGLDSGQEGNS